MTAAVYRHMRHADRASIEPEGMTHSELVAFYRELDLVIAGRLHAGILAMLAGTPVVAIAHEVKVVGIFKLLGQPSLVVRPDRVKEELPRVVADVYGRRQEVREALVPQLREAALKSATSADLLADVLKTARQTMQA
jgi:polysaccharide pyruvyl transferase WcaK-like protein